MTINIPFEVLGNIDCFSSSIRELDERCIETKDKWDQLWDKIRSERLENRELRTPEVDFNKKKVIVITKNVTCYAPHGRHIVVSIQRLADEIIQVNSAIVSDGDGYVTKVNMRGFQVVVLGSSNLFLTVNKTVAFSEFRNPLFENFDLGELDREFSRYNIEKMTVENRRSIMDGEIEVKYGIHILDKIKEIQSEEDLEGSQIFTLEQRVVAKQRLGLSRHLDKINILLKHQQNSFFNKWYGPSLV